MHLNINKQLGLAKQYAPVCKQVLICTFYDPCDLIWLWNVSCAWVHQLKRSRTVLDSLLDKMHLHRQESDSNNLVCLQSDVHAQVLDLIPAVRVPKKTGLPDMERNSPERGILRKQGKCKLISSETTGDSGAPDVRTSPVISHSLGLIHLLSARSTT